MTQDMPTDGNGNDTEKDISNAGEIIEKRNSSSNMMQNRPIDGDDDDKEINIKNAGEILEKLNSQSDMTQDTSIDDDEGITEIAITNAGEMIEKHTYFKRNCILLYSQNHRKNYHISKLKICPRQLSLRLAIENQILLIHH